jgi:hypothetical protein
MGSRSLGKRQCESTKEYSVRYDAGVISVRIKILEFVVEQICYPNRDKPVPFGQTVIDCGIYRPEIIFACFKGGSGNSLKDTTLTDIIRLQRGAPARRVKKIDPQGNTVCLNAFRTICE